MKRKVEVAIIGGGPAGSAAAIHLKDLGFDVCLVEKKSFPRETLCGEFLSVEVIKAIDELGLTKKFLLQNPNPINTFRFINDDQTEVSADFGFTAYGLKRGTFDYLLLTAAEKAGVEIIQPAEVKSISNENGYFVLTIKKETDEEVPIISKYLIAAYGKQNTLDKSLGRTFVDYKSRLNGVKFHINSEFIRCFDKKEIRIYAAEGIYCGVNAVNENIITFCFLEDRNTLQLSPKQQLIRLSKKNLGFSNLFNKNPDDIFNNLPVYGTGNIFFGKKEHVINGIYMIGDAAGVIAPLAGDGIGMAFESANLVSKILLKVKTGKISSQSGYQLYVKEWENIFRKRLNTAMLIQTCIMNNILRSAGIISVKFFPFLLKNFIKSTRTKV